MSSPWNEFAYMQQFDGNLHAESEPVPVRVNTSLRIMAEDTAREVRKYNHRSNCVPTYVFVQPKQQPLHPSLQAMGRHYFKW